MRLGVQGQLERHETLSLKRWQKFQNLLNIEGEKLNEKILLLAELQALPQLKQSDNIRMLEWVGLWVSGRALAKHEQSPRPIPRSRKLQTKNNTQ